eukprot:jgi/Chrzof1/6479/Cz18g12170.t1
MVCSWQGLTRGKHTAADERAGIVAGCVRFGPLACHHAVAVGKRCKAGPCWVDSALTTAAVTPTLAVRVAYKCGKSQPLPEGEWMASGRPCCGAKVAAAGPLMLQH